MKLAIFDFDGTLFDSMGIWKTAGDRFLLSVGMEPAPGLQERLREMSLYEAACYLRETYSLPLSPEEIMEKINGIVADFYFYQAQPKPGAAAFTEALRKKGFTLCIATASERPHIEAALKRCGMDALFEKIFTCTEVGSGKDSPAIFRRALDFFHGDRAHTLVFEDALHAARTAKQDGFRVVGVYDKSEPRQEEMKTVCDKYLGDFQTPTCLHDLNLLI